MAQDKRKTRAARNARSLQAELQVIPGRPADAVLMGANNTSASSRSRRFSDALDDFRSAVDLADLEIDPDEVFATRVSRARALATRIRRQLSGRKHSDSTTLIAEDRCR